MKYFYDHQTDAVSVIISEQFDYSHTEELAPGVMLYLDDDTKGLVPLYARAITTEELQRRMLATAAGRMAWVTVQPRLA